MTLRDKYVLNVDNIPMPIGDTIRWAQWCETADRVLARTEFTLPAGWFSTQDVIVQTFFLSIDHAFGDERPVLFETLLAGGVFMGIQFRSSDYWDALYIHRFVVGLLGEVRRARDVEFIRKILWELPR